MFAPSKSFAENLRKTHEYLELFENPFLNANKKEITESYYQNAFGKTGVMLKKELHNIIDNYKRLSYNALWEVLRDTDEDLNNRNTVILLYTGRSQGKNTNGSHVDNWNREHVWAKSHSNFGTSPGPGTDLHHIRATDVSVNSSRGNLDFDNGGTPHVGVQPRYV